MVFRIVPTLASLSIALTCVFRNLSTAVANELCFEAQQVCDRIIIIHNGNVMANGSPDELINENACNTLEEAYVALTQEKARIRFEDSNNDKGLTKIWNKLFRPKTPSISSKSEVIESE